MQTPDKGRRGNVDADLAIRRLVTEYLEDSRCVVAIAPKKREPSTFQLSLGKFDPEDGGVVVWMPNPKQAYLGDVGTTYSALEELEQQHTVPVLLSSLSPALRRFVEANAWQMHDWLGIRPNLASIHRGFKGVFQGGGSMKVMIQAATVVEEKAKEVTEDKDTGSEQREEATKAPPPLTEPTEAAEEPRRGRSMARASKRQPSSSPASTKPATKKPASPVKEEPAGAATPATASRRSSRLAGLARRSETPSEAMKKLNMSE